MKQTWPLIKTLMWISICTTLLFQGCQKLEFTEIENPAYLRVFNSLNLPLTNSNDSIPFLCMFINPEFDNQGNIVGAETIADYLDKRNPYAPPFPSHVGVSTSKFNSEYPGKETVLVGPLLNGFDLSSWAQISSGKKRIVFVNRPRNETPYMDLPKEQVKNNVILDSTIDLIAQEVYTLNVIFKDIKTLKKGMVMRRETFHKQSFSDSLIYVNFYNYSAKGFANAPNTEKIPTGKRITTSFEYGIRDTMNIYLTLLQGQNFTSYKDGLRILNITKASPNFNQKFFGSVIRDLSSNATAPYHGFPIWVNKNQNGISTDLWQQFFFLNPTLQLKESNFYELANTYFFGGAQGVIGDLNGYYASISCNFNTQNYILYFPYKTPSGGSEIAYMPSANFPNLLINTHSGYDNPKSFATVNSFEVINGRVYLTSIQRRYDPPKYN